MWPRWFRTRRRAVIAAEEIVEKISAGNLR
jgi:hypothetical protein